MSDVTGEPDKVLGYATEHSIEDPFTGEITVSVRLGPDGPRPPMTATRIAASGSFERFLNTLIARDAQAEQDWLEAEIQAGRIVVSSSRWYEWRACGHRAMAPSAHDDTHPHYCPVCEPGQRVKGCDVEYRVSPRAAIKLT